MYKTKGITLLSSFYGTKNEAYVLKSNMPFNLVFCIQNTIKLVKLLRLRINALYMQ